jgi:Flp pilus assembly protein TadD
MTNALRAAISAYNSGNLAETIELLQDLLQDDKQNWVAWFYLGMSYGHSGETDNAYRIMQVVAALCPNTKLRESAREALQELDPDQLAARRVADALSA